MQWRSEPINAIDRLGRRKRRREVDVGVGERDSKSDMGKDSRGWVAVPSSGLVFLLMCRKGGLYLWSRRTRFPPSEMPHGSVAEDTLTVSRADYLPRGSVHAVVVVGGEGGDRRRCGSPHNPPIHAHHLLELRVSCTGNTAALIFSPLVWNSNEVTGLKGLSARSSSLLFPRGWPVCLCVFRITSAWGHAVHHLRIIGKHMSVMSHTICHDQPVSKICCADSIPKLARKVKTYINLLLSCG